MGSAPPEWLLDAGAQDKKCRLGRWSLAAEVEWIALDWSLLRGCGDVELPVRPVLDCTVLRLQGLALCESLQSRCSAAV